MSRRYKVALLVALYIAQGLPFGFFTGALPILLRQAGYSLTAISALSLLYLPWALKFLWAPVVDRIGRRKQWLLSLQLTSIAAAAVLASIDGTEQLALMLIAAFVFNLIAATQDIVTDGLAVRMLDNEERGIGNGIQVGAYRIGMILGGGLLLIVFDRTNWSTMFACMALLLALTVIPVLVLREPPEGESTQATPTYLLAGWLQRLLRPGMLAIIALVFCYRFGDQVISTLWGPFLTDFGLETQTIALMKGTVGSLTSLAGAFLGGWFAFAVSRRHALLVSGLAQGACFILYILAAAGVGGVAMLWSATILEGVIGTIATVALFTFMMDASDPEHAGTDYTLLASIVVLVGSIGNVVGAVIADAFGYLPAFVIGAALSVAGCLTLVWTLDRRPLSSRIEAAWRGTSALAPARINAG